MLFIKVKSSYLFVLILIFVICKVQHGQLVLSSNDDASLHVQTSDQQHSMESQHRIDEQEKIDTIVRAFKHLPAPEIERLGVDVNEKILVGTESAEMLKRAWVERQKELKIALSSMVKPAEHMGEIIRRLLNFTTSHDDIVASLIELETFLADIDNARDFHTIGGWPILVSKLAKHNPLQHRMYAAWAVGTAVKNSYEYQLWTLETPNSSIPILQDDSSQAPLETSTEKEIACIQYLVEIIGEPTSNNDDSLQKRALYAVSAAARGNTEVQKALLQHNPDTPSQIPFLKDLYTLAISNTTSPELSRKIWALVSDMMEERNYIRFELAAALEAMAGNMKAEIDSFELLGDEFCKNAWVTAAAFTVQKSLEDEKFNSLVNSLEERDSLDGNDIYTDETQSLTSISLIADSVSIDGDSVLSSAILSEDAISVKHLVDDVKKSLLPLRATLSSLLKSLREFKAQCPESFEGPVGYLVTSQAQRIASLQPHGGDDIVDQAISLLAIDSNGSKGSNPS